MTGFGILYTFYQDNKIQWNLMTEKKDTSVNPYKFLKNSEVVNISQFSDSLEISNITA